MYANPFQTKVIFRDSCSRSRDIENIFVRFTVEDSLSVNVFGLRMTKQCNIVLCTFLFYNVKKFDYKQIECVTLKKKTVLQKKCKTIKKSIKEQ